MTEPDEHAHQELELREQGGVFATRDPEQMIVQATAAANQLMAVVEKAGLKSRIGGKDYLQVEAWTTLGVMVGCTARTEWTRPVEGGWEAAVEVVNGTGMVIGRAEAQCLRAERNWANRDDFALRSMAQTRAMGKALRMPLGWIAVLAGFAATPAEEMVPPRVAEEIPHDVPPQPERSRTDRMRDKITELCVKADGVRGTQGATWAELQQLIAWRHDPDGGTPLSAAKTWEDCTDDDLAFLGGELAAFVDQGCLGSLAENAKVPF